MDKRMKEWMNELVKGSVDAKFIESIYVYMNELMDESIDSLNIQWMQKFKESIVGKWLNKWRSTEINIFNN